jgi:hypothetical protein
VRIKYTSTKWGRGRLIKRIVAALHDFRYYGSNGIPWKIFLGSDELAFHAVNYTESLVPIGGCLDT